MENKKMTNDLNRVLELLARNKEGMCINKDEMDHLCYDVNIKSITFNPGHTCGMKGCYGFDVELDGEYNSPYIVFLEPLKVEEYELLDIYEK